LRHRDKTKSIWIWSAAFLLSALALCLARRPLLYAIGDHLVVQDDLVPADVIHVLSGPNYRVDYGVRLYHEGYGTVLHFTGRGGQASSHKRRAVRQGVPESAIVADGSWVTSTYSEALRLQAYIAESETPIDSVIVSSDAYHMRRARWTYRQVLGDRVRVQMAPAPFEESPFVREWWTHRSSRKRVLEEYAKLAYYLARYKLFRGPIREWLASLDRF
jgi:uncharacterized SAM-binding protein YcdF (DUF218 family)